MPKTTDATLLDTLAHALLNAWDLYTFKLATGWVRYTSGSSSFTYGGNTWQPAGIKRGTLENLDGTHVSTLDLEVRISTWPALAVNGDLDEIEVVLERAYLLSWSDTPTMLSQLFAGPIVDVRPTPVGVNFTVKDHLYRGESECPPRVCGPSCPWVFGGTECGYDLNSVTTTGLTTTTGSTATVVKLTAPPGSNCAAGGTILFTSGALDTIKRTVQSVSGSDVTVARPLPSVPASGVTLSATRGCARTLSVCSGYGRLARFGGFPHVPRKQ